MSFAFPVPAASRVRRLAIAALALLGGACVPYAVATTAQPVPRGEMLRSNVTYFVPAGVDLRSDSTASASYVGLDSELRFGLGDGMDVGLRFPGLAGAVVNVKRRLGSGDATRAASAVMMGAGVVNGGNHALLEATVVTSGRERDTATPYGGARAMHVLPLNDVAVSDTPTIGLFGGVRLGSARGGFSPELGIYYDRSALGLRSSSIIVVPSVTLHARRGSGFPFLR